MPQNPSQPAFQIHFAREELSRRYPRPRPFQFGLRAMFGLTTAVAVAASVWKVYGAEGYQLLAGPVAFAAFQFAPLLTATAAAATGKVDLLRIAFLSSVAGAALFGASALIYFPADCARAAECLLGLAAWLWPVQGAAIALAAAVSRRSRRGRPNLTR